MPFEFQLEDGSSASIDDYGHITIYDASGKLIDTEAEEAAIALGFEPSDRYELFHLWRAIVEELHESKQFHPLFYEVAGGTQRFDTDDFLRYLGPLLEEWLKHDNPNAVGLARLLSSLRKPDGSGYEFELADGEWEEETRPELCRVWSAVDRTLFADDIELMEWLEDFERDIYDPIRLGSDVDLSREQHFDVAASYKLPAVIEALGLTAREKELDEQAAEDAPAPWHPDVYKEGEYGVLYEYDDLEQLPGGRWAHYRVVEVVPYMDLTDAQSALEISEAALDDRDYRVDDDGNVTTWDGKQEYYYRMFIVQRLPPELARLRRLEREEQIAERKFLLKQTPLFEQDEIPIVEPWDPEIDVWVRPEEYDELMEMFEDE